MHGVSEIRQQIIFKGIINVLLCSSILLALLLPVILWPLLTIHQVPGNMWHFLYVQFAPFSFLKELEVLFSSAFLHFSQILISAMKNAWLFLCSGQRIIFLFVNIIHTEAKFSVALSCHLSHNCGWMSLFENQAHPGSYKFSMTIFGHLL